MPLTPSFPLMQPRIGMLQTTLFIRRCLSPIGLEGYIYIMKKFFPVIILPPAVELERLYTKNVCRRDLTQIE